MIFCLLTRSAIIPPSGDIIIIGMIEVAETIPNSTGLPLTFNMYKFYHINAEALKCLDLSVF